MIERLAPGDIVEVRSPAEILQTLDVDGTLNRLPFMPEMVDLCGQTFQVSKRVVKTCYYTKAEASGMRKFAGDGVVLLDGLRCSGAAHDGCQKGCRMFWREAWLRKLDSSSSSVVTAESDNKKDSAAVERLRARLKTMTGPKTYFCQSSEILNATEGLSRWERFGKCFDEVGSGNCGWIEMAGRIAIWLFWRIRRVLFGAYARGSNKSTPAGSLNLHEGEWVEVKSVQDISDTLNETAHNRGLYFTPGMAVSCSRRHRVERKIEKIIVDGTGEMRQLRNTVYLEGSMCGCAHVAFGGCPRGEFSYWREIWLRRVPAQVQPEVDPTSSSRQNDSSDKDVCSTVT